MATYQLTQTGEQVQADLDKIETILTNDNEFSGENTFKNNVTFTTDANVTFNEDATFNQQAIFNGNVVDKNASVGTSGQVLTSTGAGVEWADASGGSHLYMHSNQ